MLYMQRPIENLPRRWTQTMRCVRYLLGQISTQGAQKNEKILSQLFQEHCKKGQIKKMLSQIFQEHCKEGVKKVGATLWWKKASHNCVLYPQVRLVMTVCIDYFESRTKMWLCYISYFFLLSIMKIVGQVKNGSEPQRRGGSPRKATGSMGVSWVSWQNCSGEKK